MIAIYNYYIILHLDTETAATRFISKEQTIRTSDVIELVSSMASACPLGLYYAAVSGCIEAGGGCDLEGKSTRVMGRLNMSNLYIQSTTSPTTSSSPSQYKSNSISYRSGNIRSANKSNYFNEKGKKVIKGHDSINQPSSDEQQQILKSMSMQAGKAMFPLPSGKQSIYISLLSC